MNALTKLKELWRLAIELRNTRIMLRYFTDPNIIRDIKLNIEDIRSQMKDLLR